MRTIVDLTTEQIARLDRIADREHISRAEAVRRAIDVAYPAGNARQSVADIRRKALGLWKGRKRDAVAYVNALRDEWER